MTMHAHVIPPLVEITFLLLIAKRLCLALKTQLTMPDKESGGSVIGGDGEGMAPGI